MTEKKLERFGRYLILDHLVNGGMAKICRAVQLGEQADKIVAIKMIQPQFSVDPAFKTMFMDEIKVSIALQHPNIAQLYDYGLHDGHLYNTLEYVDGANLKQYLDRLKEKNFVFPVSISIFIISQVCQALHYAHTFTDRRTGKPFNIVHRDISPHNIMLAYDGAVKVIDFGIAKAETNTETTQAGTIKGKLSYLAPEYVEGLPLDHRYDQFAVGVTLWELLCCRKLFSANNDIAIIKLVQACKIPVPSTINPNVPPELDQIVLKALSKDRNQRFENMDMFNRALIKFLYARYPDFNPSDLGYFAKQLFAEEIKRDREKMLGFGKIDLKTYIEEWKKETNGGEHSATASKEGSGVAANDDAASRPGKRELEFDFAKDKENMKSLGLGTKTASRVSKSSGKIENSNKTSTSNAVSQSALSTPRHDYKDRTRTMSRQLGKKSSAGSLWGIVLAASLAGLYFYGDQLKLSGAAQSQQKRDLASQKKALAEEKKEQQKGKIFFSGLHPMMEIFINGEKIKFNGLAYEVNLDQDIVVKVVKEGFFPYSSTVVLTSAKPTFEIVVPELKEARYGLLSTTPNINDGSEIVLNLDGENIKLKSPVENYRLPAGSYQVLIKDPVFGGEKTVKIDIEENRKTTLE